MAQIAKDKEEKITKKEVKKGNNISKRVSPVLEKSGKSLKSKSVKSSSKLINEESSILENIFDAKDTVASSLKSVAKQKSKAVKSIASKKIKDAKNVVDNKVKSAKKSTDKEVKVIKKVVDKESKVAKASADKKVKAVKKSADKEVKAVKKSADKEVKAVKKSVDKEVKAIKKDANKKTKATKKAIDSKVKVARKSVAKKASTLKKAVAEELKKVKDKVEPFIVEYYDLPYKYNKTVVKVLAQNPNTLFVYWEISDEDRKSLEEKYGNRFFFITKPVLVITNLTDNYSYEIDINDFANNWYIHVNDTKCRYRVELGRRPIEMTIEVPIDYVPITDSNVIECPNDHVLFFNEGDRIYFKNIKTNDVSERVYRHHEQGVNLKEIYKNYKLSEEENRFDFKNPSSQNPTSNVM